MDPELLTAGRSDTNTYATCPAATGECAMPGCCSVYPDTAHRCRQDRRPVHARHECVCGFSWYSAEQAVMFGPQGPVGQWHPPAQGTSGQPSTVTTPSAGTREAAT